MSEQPIKAVLWDFGGVILSSPFEAFARYEATKGLKANFIRELNALNPHDNAWAKLERGEVMLDQFANLFEREAAALGGKLNGQEVIALLSGDIRPEMVAALRNIAKRYKTACLTNNVKIGEGPGMARSAKLAAEITEIMSIFDCVVESSKVGVRKPEPRFYEIACEMLGVEPGDAIFLDDLGINLKPAKAMGMRTIKVSTPAQALGELEQLLGHPVR